MANQALLIDEKGSCRYELEEHRSRQDSSLDPTAKFPTAVHVVAHASQRASGSGTSLAGTGGKARSERLRLQRPSRATRLPDDPLFIYIGLRRYTQYSTYFLDGVLDF